MSRDLGSQYGTIKSPWPDYAVYSFPDASRCQTPATGDR